MTDDHTLADVLELVLAGRPERVTAVMVASAPSEARAAYALVRDAIAALAGEEQPVDPPAPLRSRLMTTLAARAAAKATRRKAVLVCDMLNDHLTPGRPLEVPRARAIVPALAALLDDARMSGVPVVYVLDRHRHDDPELDVWGSHAVEGTEGAEVWPPLAPKPGDVQVTKPAISAFFQTELEKTLDELGVDTLVLTGCATEVQLMATATDALQRGFAVEMPADSQAGTSEPAERVTMAVLAALAPYAPARIARLEKSRALTAT